MRERVKAQTCLVAKGLESSGNLLPKMPGHARGPLLGDTLRFTAAVRKGGGIFIVFGNGSRPSEAVNGFR
jgi:hypothetical protein